MTCTHGKLCPDCRSTPLPAAELPPLEEALADVVAPDRVIEAGQVDYAVQAARDLQQLLGRAGYVVLRREDADELLDAYRTLRRRRRKIDPRLVLRVSEALSAVPALRLFSGNVVPPRPEQGDHGVTPTPLTQS